MPKVYKLFCLMVLLLGSITLSTAVTFAATSPRVTYAVQDNFAYIEVDGHMNLNEVTWPIMLEADYRDAGMLQTPNKLMIEATIEGVNHYFEFDINSPGELFGFISIWSNQQDGVFVDFETDDGAVFTSGGLGQTSSYDDIYMAWVIPYADASPVI